MLECRSWGRQLRAARPSSVAVANASSARCSRPSGSSSQTASRRCRRARSPTAAEIPVATLYQYFKDRDAIIQALIERQVEAMAPRLAAALEPLQTYSIRTIVEAIVGAYVDGYRDYPSYVVLWFQGRVNPEIDAYGP